MLFITAGLGGGTGGGSSAIIAESARSMGILTVAVVTKPFSFEGYKRKKQAEEALEGLRGKVDTLIVIPNDKDPLPHRQNDASHGGLPGGRRSPETRHRGHLRRSSPNMVL